MIYVSVFIRTESADYMNMLLSFNRVEDFESKLLERTFESPCYWSDYLIESSEGEVMDETLRSIVQDLIEDCIKDQEENEED